MEGVGLGDDLIAAADAERPQRDDQRIGAGVDAADEPRAEELPELRLELLDLGGQLVPAADEHRGEISDQRLDVLAELVGIVVATDLHCRPPARPAPIRPDQSSSIPSSTVKLPCPLQQRCPAALDTSAR